MLLISCDEGNNSPPVNYNLDIMIVDQNGNDMLDPTAESGIKESTIKVSYIKDGKEVSPRILTPKHGELDYPEGYDIFRSEDYDVYMITLYVSPFIEYKDRSITIVKWDESHSDTINAQLIDGRIANDFLINGKKPNWQGDNWHHFIRLIK